VRVLRLREAAWLDVYVLVWRLVSCIWMCVCLRRVYVYVDVDADVFEGEDVTREW
jgi:hypothetical protein